MKIWTLIGLALCLMALPADAAEDCVFTSDRVALARAQELVEESKEHHALAMRHALTVITAEAEGDVAAYEEAFAAARAEYALGQDAYRASRELACINDEAAR